MLVKFLKFCRPPDESYKWYNRPEYREVFINPECVAMLETQILNLTDIASETITYIRIHLTSGTLIDVEDSSVDEVNKKLFG